MPPLRDAAIAPLRRAFIAATLRAYSHTISLFTPIHFATPHDITTIADYAITPLRSLLILMPMPRAIRHC